MTKLAILNSLSIALNLRDLIPEIQPLLSKSRLIDYLTTKSQDNLSSSAEALQILQRIAKNYPHHLLEKYDQVGFNAYLNRLLSTSDRKRVIASLKIVEEWVKSYKSETLISGEGAGEGGGNDSDEEETKEAGFSIGKDPYSLESFREIMKFIVRE